MSGARPRALMIAPAMPATTGNGLAMRLGMFLEALSSFAATDLIVIAVSGPAQAPARLPDRLGVATTIIPVAGRADTHFQLLSRLRDAGERLAAFRRYGRGSLAAHLSAPVLNDVRAIAGGRHYDIVHVGRSYLAEAGLAVARPARITLDLDEDDSRVWPGIARLARQAGDDEAAAWLMAEAEASDRLLAAVWPRFDAVFAASRNECAALGARHPGLVAQAAPNAVACGRGRRRSDGGWTLLFVGSFGYSPNIDAICWFVDRIWPRIRARARRSPRLIVVGRDAPAAVRSLARRPGVTIRGDVDDLAPVYAASTVAIAPLRAGGGTRIKLLEAAAQGVAMVATSTAAEGLALDRSAAWIADGEAAFADAVLEALARPAERRRRTRRASGFVRRFHDRAVLVRRLACQLHPAPAH